MHLPDLALSPYLTALAQREGETRDAIRAAGPDAVCDLALGTLAGVAPTLGRAQTAALLRTAKRRVALTAALADIGGAWSLAQVTGALSDLADGALRLTAAHLLRAAHDRGELRLPHPAAPARGSGFSVLAMGKLGARELNFSSDVDLILIYDPEAHAYSADTLGAIFARLARDLVSMMQAPDAGGIVFRTDLRLRPDPGSTPPAIALPAALAYYEGAAQTWERAAMIKARPVAGDLALGQRFVSAVRPFVWRRHLDFAAIADIRAMKQRMDAHSGAALADGGPPEARLSGHDLKLGHGGIREVEFCAQTLQLVWGGRNPALRTPATLDALQALGAAQHLPAATVAALSAAYALLRRTEHRLQMVDDRQTHSLPATPDGLDRFARFMGSPDARALCAGLLPPMLDVRATFAGLLEQPGAPPDLGEPGAAPDTEGVGAAPRTDRAGAPPDIGNTSAAPDTGKAGASPDTGRAGAPPNTGRASAPPPDTTRAGAPPDTDKPAGAPPTDPAAPPALPPQLEAWLAGRPRALRTERARTLLRQMLPALAGMVARQPDPGAVWARLDEFIHRLPEGVQLFSMLSHNPALLERLGEVLGAAPSLADHLAAIPSALEGLAAPQDIDADPQASLAAQLGDARAPDEALAIASRFVRGEEFRLAVAELDTRLDQDSAGAARTALAEAAIGALLPLVLADHARRYGRLRGGALAVVALGKAGSREMMAGSDLDLMLIYDHPDEVAESTGPVHLAPSQYFARAAHAVVAALTVPTRHGKLYDVDMRLRPSGGKGPVAVSLAAFIRYHRESAWTWERLSLTRARVVAGPAVLRRRVAAAIGAALGQGDPARILPDTLAMRRRLLTEMPPAGPWDAKLRPGGLMEVEFIAQALQLRHAGQRRLLCPITRVALANLARAGALAPADAARLIEADAAWRAIQGLLRITLGRTVPASLPPAAAARTARALDRVLGAAPGVDLATRVELLAAGVREVFCRIVGDVDASDRGF